MMPGIWLAGAALVAALLAGWAYAWREERVPGRWGPALLRAGALFLLLAGLMLPPLMPPPASQPARVAVLDVSRSMELPADPDRSSTFTRLDSARILLRTLEPDRVYMFGDAVVASSLDSAFVAAPGARMSRLAPALEAARLAGADSVWLITDGEIDDREAALQTAERLGLGVLELRVGTPSARVGLSTVVAPVRVRAGDSAHIAVDVVAGGPAAELPDTVSLMLHAGDRRIAERRVAVPEPGRRTRAELSFLVPATGTRNEWNYYEVSLSPGADPLELASRRGSWIEVGGEETGAVLVSTSPDWEPRFLLPMLNRAALGGARGFMRVSDGRWLELGTQPRVLNGTGIIETAIRSARLLAVHGQVDDLPAWLRRWIETHPRRLLLPREEGPLPGTPVALTAILPGEWYPAAPVPPGPTFGLIADADLADLPPLSWLRSAEGSSDWVPLAGRRNRRGEERPLFVAGRSAAGRWAAATGTGYWRWAFRGGTARGVYEGLFSGIVGWLAEDYAPRPLELLRSGDADGHLEWRVGAGVRELEIVVLDSARDSIWSNTWAAGGDGQERLEPVIRGPSLPVGRYAIVARGRSTDEPFRFERPVDVEDTPRELEPRRESALLATATAPADRQDSDGRRRPVWPFGLAIVFLCGEWLWRHRIGLR
jgi:hypothetical protein